uniref:hypothetical protein n=1 Tax=Nocardia suismassiliense TaxID=2077092 RepID=UPI003F4906D7
MERRGENAHAVADRTGWKHPTAEGLLNGIQEHAVARLDDDSLAELYDAAIKDTIARLEALGSPVVTDGEQRKSSL